MRHWLPRLLIIASLGLHVITVASYVRQPDSMAAFTVYPIWMWSILGLLFAAAAFLFWRAQLSLLLIVLWLLIALTQSDESHALSNLGNEIPEPGKPAPYQDLADHAKIPTIRICTLNWGAIELSSEEVSKQAKIIADYQPDILFMQEVTESHAGTIADIVYPIKGDFRATGRSVIMTRGQIDKLIFTPMKHSQHATIKLDGQLIDCINFQLKSAITDMRLWQKSCWEKHSANRKTQRKQVNLSLSILKQNNAYPRRPVIAAGDFNAPASDPLHDLLRSDFADSFSKVGSGWANTWHRRIPFQRIDYIYSSYTRPALEPVRSCNVVVPASDHLMVVSDFILLR